MTDHRAAKLDTTTSRDLGTATQDRMWSLLRLFDLDAEPQFVVPDIVVLIMHWLGAISSWCGPSPRPPSFVPIPNQMLLHWIVVVVRICRDPESNSAEGLAPNGSEVEGA
ncbi:unnamed protein product [Urochloa humidicola]